LIKYSSSGRQLHNIKFVRQTNEQQDKTIGMTSSYSSKVRKVKITGQTDRSITAEIIINAEKALE
jgi:hypothetical protein